MLLKPHTRYYNGQILSGIAGASRTPPKGIAWPVPEVPVTFLPVAGQELPEGVKTWSPPNLSNKGDVLCLAHLGTKKGSKHFHVDTSDQ